MHRFFTAPEDFPAVTGSDAHQIKDVLRMKPGEQIELLTGDGQVHEAKIISLAKGRVACAVLSSRQDESEPKTRVTLAQALPKARKMDLVVEKCVELGVHRIIPMLSERVIAKEGKPERWQKIAKEAAEQSKRAIIPQVGEAMNFRDVLKLKGRFELALIPWEAEKQHSLKQALSGKTPGSILLLIGPEGGFSATEVDLARQAGFVSVSLGKRILRTETAGFAALAAINYELG